MKIQRNNAMTTPQAQATPAPQQTASTRGTHATDSLSTGRKLLAAAMGALALAGGAAARGLPNFQAAPRTPTLPTRQTAGGNQGSANVAADLAHGQRMFASAPLPALPPAIVAGAPQPSAQAPSGEVLAPASAPKGAGAPEQGDA